MTKEARDTLINLLRDKDNLYPTPEDMADAILALIPSLPAMEWTEKCPDRMMPCTSKLGTCHGTGTITRTLTYGEMGEVVRKIVDVVSHNRSIRGFVGKRTIEIIDEKQLAGKE